MRRTLSHLKYFLPILFLAALHLHAAASPRPIHPNTQWQQLFNGTSLQGWVQRGGKAKYAVRGKMIVGTTVKGTPNSFLCTDRNYANFILEYHFKVDPRLNSGVQIRSHSLKNYRNGRVHGYQVEIDPSKRAWSGGIYEEARRGWLCDLKNNKPARKAFKQDEWNHVRVEAIGPSIRTWLNGVPAADLVDDMTPTGFIALQVHATNSPSPFEVSWRHLRVIDLGPISGTTRDLLGGPTDTMGAVPPPGCLVLLGDKDDLSQWVSADNPGTACPWQFRDSALEIIPKKGSIVTKRTFRDFRMHLEFRVSSKDQHSQDNGNSGVYIQRRYEVQILNSHGQPLGNHECGAIYKTKAPDTNACREANKWQSYDIVFRSPRWDAKGKKTQNARITVLQNGTLIHDNVDIPSKTGAGRQEGPEDGPIMLQDHGNPVSFRNIWIQDLLTLTLAASGFENAWNKLLVYEYGQSRAPLLLIENTIKRANSEQRGAVEAKLTLLLLSNAPTIDAKRFACRVLARIGSDRAVPALGSLVADRDLATEAQQALCAIPTESANVMLREGLKSKAPARIKAGIVNSLARRRDAGSLPQLVDMYSDTDPVLAEAAVAAIGKIGGPEAEKAFLGFSPPAALRHTRDQALLACAAAAIDAKREDAARALCLTLIKSAESDVTKLGACRELVRLQGTAALPQILQLIKTVRGDEQRIAAKTAAEIPGAATAERMVSILPELPPSVQAVVIRALADRGDKQVAPIVADLLESPETAVRLAAIDALATLGGAAQVKPLTALALAKGPQAGKAAHALAVLPGTGAEEVMLETLAATENAALRRLLVQTLSARYHKPAVPQLLQRAASDPDSAVRRECLKAIRVLGSADQVAKLLELMATCTQTRDLEEARRTVETLAQNIPAAERDALLLKAWNASGEKARLAIGGLMGTFGGEATEQTLIAGLKEKNDALRYAAVKALGSWSTPAPAPALLEFAKTTQNEVHHVLAMRGFVRLVGMITTGNTKGKYEAAMAVARRPQEKELLKSAMMELKITDLKAGSKKPYELIAKSFRLEEKPYIDREYTFTHLPDALAIADRIKTAMNDKYSKGDAFLTFTVSKPARVFVCYDHRAKNLPKWLRKWTKTKTAIASTDRGCKLVLYTKVVPAGKVALGGNAAPGAGAMYIVGVAALPEK